MLVASLLASTAVAVLWVRSHRSSGEALVYCDDRPRPNPHGRDFPVWHVYSFCSFRGRLGVERLAYQDVGFLEGGVYRRDPLYIPRSAPPPWAGHGFSSYTGVRDDVAMTAAGDIGSETGIRGVTAPHWAVLAVCAAPAAWTLFAIARRRRREGARGFPVEEHGRGEPKHPRHAAAEQRE